MRALKKREADFCEAYLRNGGNGTEAALEAGYARNGNRAVAANAASRLLRREEVTAYLAARSREIFRQMAITPERVAAEYWRNYQKLTRAVPVLDSDGEETGEYTFDARNALRALDKLGEYLRMFTSRVEVQPGPGVLENLSEDELRALIRVMEGENDHDGKTGGQPDAGDPQ